jgi:hypothetical protein
VRFSPYAFVEPKSDRVLHPAELENALADKAVHVWGAFDGSGDPIRMAFATYFRRFVWDADFTSAPQIAVDHPVSHGNTVDNAREAYPRGHFVEFYLPGDPAKAGMDWRALKLVFEKDHGAWMLVGIVHSEWTI